MNGIQAAKSSWLLSILEREPFKLPFLFFSTAYKKPVQAAPVKHLGARVIIHFSYLVESVAKIASRALFKLSTPLLSTFNLSPYFKPKAAEPIKTLCQSAQHVPIFFGDIPLFALEKIAMHLSLQDLGAFTLVSKQTALAAAAPDVWQMWSTRFALEPSDTYQVVRSLACYFTVDDKNQVWLKQSLAHSQMEKALTAYPKPCFIMQASTRPKYFHFSFRSTNGEIKLYRDVALGCPLSERFINASKIINDERYLQIKVLARPVLQTS